MGKSDRKGSGTGTPAKGVSSAAEPDQPQEGEEVDKAFDLWLQRGLHQLYDTVAKEPIPEELLRLIEDDRAAREDK